ncbi:hypothetical protein K7432_000753 [Basidiobolus ranarum]|uniref:THO1-MOS11 C-terminal domain-containing protein n=1 Tax=Basidiobolus ranarum TaxID=34480 RepID=A0ABR2X481_9FUNG
MSTIDEEFANLAPPENFDWDEAALGNDVDLPPELRPSSPFNELETLPPLIPSDEEEAEVEIHSTKELSETSISLEDTKLEETVKVEASVTNIVCNSLEAEKEKKKQRALRFGIPLSDTDKVVQRAKPVRDPVAQVSSELKVTESSTLKIAPPSDKTEEIERAIKRAERFGLSLTEEQKVAKRALRFGLPVPDEVIKKNPVGDKQKIKQVNPQKSKRVIQDKRSNSNTKGQKANPASVNNKLNSKKSLATKPKQNGVKKSPSPQKAKVPVVRILLLSY